MSAFQLVVAVVLALAATTGGVAYAANASNPGDALYGLDLAMENIQLDLATNVSSKVQLRIAFANERLSEAQALFSKDDVADGLEAVNEYGTQVSAIAQLIQNTNGADRQALTSLVDSAQGIHKDELTKLLTKVPEQAKGSIQKVLDAANTSIGNPSSAPDNTGNNSKDNINSDGAGNNPESNGNSNGAGNHSNGNGNPNNSGNNSNGNGKPDGAGNNPNNNGSGNPNGKP